MISPKYSTRIKGDRYTIHVSISGRFFKFAALTEKEKIHFFLKEAAKSPLKGIACIHKYARKNDSIAKEVADVYASYQSFLETRDPTLSEKLSAALQNKKLRLLIETLLPGIAATLQTKPLKLAYVEIPEMQARYNAFPDLIRYQDNYFLAFREGNKHQGDLGKVRILKGQPGKWEKEALIESSQYDLRDPKFFIDGSGELNLIIGGSIIKKQKTVAMVPHLARLKSKWKLEQPQVPYPKLWIWQIAWHEDAGYGFAYGPNDYKTLYLMKTTDGRSFEKIAEISSDFTLTETTLHFQPDGSAIALIRADPKTLIARSSPPYKKWTLHTLPFHGGGQNFIPLKKGYLATTRHLFLSRFNRLHERQLIAYLDEKIIPIQTLQSQLDTGYAGIVLEDDGSFTISYYSADNNKQSLIYISNIVL